MIVEPLAYSMMARRMDSAKHILMSLNTCTRFG